MREAVRCVGQGSLLMGQTLNLGPPRCEGGLLNTQVWFFTIKPTRCTNSSNLFLEWNYVFWTVPLSIIRSFHCTHSNAVCHTGLLTACEQDQDGTPCRSCLQAVSKPVWHIPLLCVQWKTPDDGQRNCLKHVEFHSQNKFEKLVHLVGFIIRNLSWCMVTWMSNSRVIFGCWFII